MAIIPGLLVSKGEEGMYRRLTRFSDKFAVFAKVRFFDVFTWNTENLRPKEHSYLEKTHFDFVICDRSGRHKPLFAVEFDGIGNDYATLDPYLQLKRQLKERVSRQESFPLLWLDKLNEIEGTTIFEAILQSFIGHRSYEKLIQEGILSWEESFIYDFPPFARLNKKVGLYRISQTAKILDPKGSVQLANEFMADEGTYKVSHRAVVRAVEFPGFHSLELAYDIAGYRCLKDFDKALATGRVSVAKIDGRRRAIATELQKRQVLKRLPSEKGDL